MRITDFTKHINPKNIFNPYDAYLMGVVAKTEIDKTLLLPPGTRALVGRSATGKGDSEHHIFERNLFPIYGRYGRGTRTLICSSKRHEELHRVLADCLSKGNFVDYEVAIKVECPGITDDISSIYLARIAELRFGLFARVYTALSRLNPFHKLE